MSTTLPKITVVTPSFDQAHYIETTFKSVIDQNYPNLEWIVVDGGSTDGTVDLIKKYEKHFAWWVSERDRNHPHALNKGYEKATGDIFCFVNSDDTLNPGVLHYVAQKFADPKVDWVVGWATYFEDPADQPLNKVKGKPHPAIVGMGDEWPYPPKAVEKPIDWIVSNPVPQIASFWRTSVRDKVGLFSEEYLWSFDYEYWQRMYFKGGYRPTMCRRNMGGFRLQKHSKTVSKPQNYGPDNEKLTKLYGAMLPPDQKARLKREQQKKANRLIRDKAWLALKMGNQAEAKKHALSAIAHRFNSVDAWKAAYAAWRGY
ncbi:MAG TPA: glycosyltransferase family 2 protein [Humisphaera sp.]